MGFISFILRYDPKKVRYNIWALQIYKQIYIDFKNSLNLFIDLRHPSKIYIGVFWRFYLVLKIYTLSIRKV